LKRKDAKNERQKVHVFHKNYSEISMEMVDSPICLNPNKPDVSYQLERLGNYSI
jgi:hypothetical protein